MSLKPLKEVSVFGLSIQCGEQSDLIEVCQKAVLAKRGVTVAFVNVHSLMESADDLSMRETLSSFSVRAPDGMPVVWLLKTKGHTEVSRVSGPDFMATFLEMTCEEPHGFIGGRPEQIEFIKKRFQLKEVVHYSPPFRGFSVENAQEDWREFLSKSEGRALPHFIWVGLGAPKQERWIQAIAPLSPQTSFFAVGAAFDFLSDTKARAPEWMRNNGLEWLHRLASEPRRLGPRYLSSNLKFLSRLPREIFKTK